MKLHTYFRSSASYRVRIALNLKGLNYESTFVHLNRNGGEQFATQFSELNPQHLVPVFSDGETILTQSLAIIEYLDDLHPEVRLLPADAVGRARVRELSLAIACDIHPLNNLRVLKYLSDTLAITAEQKTTWYQHWTRLGLDALEQRLQHDNATGHFSHGNSPTIIDCCLVPQIYNAKRFNCDLSEYKTINRIVEHCETLDAFNRARPDVQQDAE